MNKYQPHILVLPEDDANRQIANGFLLEPDLDPRRIQILPNAGGWMAVRECFEIDYLNAMRALPLRHMVLLVDFDEQGDRLTLVREVVPRISPTEFSS